MFPKKLLNVKHLHEIYSVDLKPWKLTFDGSKTEKCLGAGVVLVSSQGQVFQFSYQLDEVQVQSNNQEEGFNYWIGVGKKPQNPTFKRCLEIHSW
ncbi:hypothetical protein ACSBR1_027866 [Camellia fascicularis]